MYELTHPVELRDQELDLVAAGGGKGGDRDHCCGGDNSNRQALVYLEDVNILSNIAVASVGVTQRA
jgi:hypothetical protein